ncbi:MAG: hypothetical protein EKK41_20170 [Hyphomicrobiales bacterium]|nr:MAG: hypothetical protein EKK41_20170 [Hyphomicrobiales bacterium]
MTPSKRQLLAGWKLAAHRDHIDPDSVGIDRERIPSLLPWLTPGPPNTAWRCYVSPLHILETDLPRLFYELALTISQFGGFIAHAGDGELVTWKRDGSGIKAILATLDAIRSDHKLPQIDITRDLEKELAHFFIRTAFGKERLDIMLEVGTPQSLGFFRNLLALARRRDGSYRFNVLHMKGLACRFPLAFGEDPVFHKKASLLLMTMEIALNQLGHVAVAETLPPADYRIPQILEGLGILRFSPELSDKVANGHVFRIEDPHVHTIRAMTVEAVGLIKAAYEERYDRVISCAELDGLLYLLSRNRELMADAGRKPHILVTTHAF